MKSISRKLLLLVTSFTLISGVVFGDTINRNGKPSSSNKEKSDFYFFSSLLPKALQTHPLVAISVITEKSDEGKKIPSPTLEKPAYYSIMSSGYRHQGDGVSDEGKVSEEILQKFVETALANSHYLPADNAHPATLILFYFWGVHSGFDAGDPESGDGGHPDIGHKNLIQRAQLVGGVKFAHEFAVALDQRDQSRMASGSQGLIGMDPVYLFSIRSDINRSLVDQILDDCYYIVVSAYDAAALVKGERKLIWRTKMSTPAQGVSLVETVPALVASGGTYFGRDMDEPSIIDKRINRKGNVELGELKVITMDEKSAEKSDKATSASSEKK